MTVKRPPKPYPYGPCPPPVLWNWQARFLRVVDGDSVWILADRGDRDTSEWELRLKRLNAPERDDLPLGPAATVFVQAWFDRQLATRGDLKWPFRVTTIKNARRELHGRFEAIIWAVGDDVSLNEALITAGVAVPA